MRIKYKKEWFVIRPGLKVYVDVRNVFGGSSKGNWVLATVEDALSVQFTAIYEDVEYGEQTVFRTYSDVGTSWKPITDYVVTQP